MKVTLELCIVVQVHHKGGSAMHTCEWKKAFCLKYLLWNFLSQNGQSFFLIKFRTAATLNKKKEILQFFSSSYSAATPTGPVGRKLTNGDANWKQNVAKFFSKQPITLKQADNARSKKFDTMTSDHDHVYDWLLSILNVLNFEHNIEMLNSQLIIKISPLSKP